MQNSDGRLVTEWKCRIKSVSKYEKFVLLTDSSSKRWRWQVKRRKIYMRWIREKIGLRDHSRSYWYCWQRKFWTIREQFNKISEECFFSEVRDVCIVDPAAGSLKPVQLRPNFFFQMSPEINPGLRQYQKTFYQLQGYRFKKISSFFRGIWKQRNLFKIHQIDCSISILQWPFFQSSNLQLQLRKWSDFFRGRGYWMFKIPRDTTVEKG